MDYVGDKPALDALPALLDGDVTGPHQGEDVSGQLGEGVLHVDGVAGRRLDIAHPVRPRQLLRLLTGHLENQKRRNEVCSSWGGANKGNCQS